MMLAEVAEAGSDLVAHLSPEDEPVMGLVKEKPEPLSTQMACGWFVNSVDNGQVKAVERNAGALGVPPPTTWKLPVIEY